MTGLLSSCLRLSLFQNTHTQRLPSSRLTLKTPLPFPHIGRAVASRSMWVYPPQAAQKLELDTHSLSPSPPTSSLPPQKHCTPAHNPHLSMSPPQAGKNASWNVKREYKRASYDSDHWIMGIKQEGKFAIHHITPFVSNVILSQAGWLYTSFLSILFFFL